MTGHSRGVALIAVLALLAAATLLMTLAVDRLALGLAGFERVRAEARAWQAVRAGEAQLGRMLGDRSGAPVRVGIDPWTLSPWVQRLGAARLECAIRDLTGGFNVNNLLSPTGEVQSAWVAAWSRLVLQARGGPGLVDALLDWQDADDDNRAGPGSEQASYRRAGLPWPVANRALWEVSQLKQLLGMRGDVYVRLAPWVVALPEPTAVNVNQAPEAVLHALVGEHSASVASALLAARPFNDAEQLANWLTGHLPTLPTSMLSVSGHFLAIDCEYEGESARLHTRHALKVKPNEALQSLGRRALPPRHRPGRS